MFVLITGGSGSGKSAYAERRAVELAGLSQNPEGGLFYLATMEVRDQESRRRIERHRNMRKDKHFFTIECQTHLEEVSPKPGDTFLLECISNLTANEMYSQSGRGRDVAQVILTGVQKLAKEAKNLIIVGNNVFEDGGAYDESTKRYIAEMAKIQNETAKLADEVVEVVCGIPLFVKTAGACPKNPKKGLPLQ